MKSFFKFKFVKIFDELKVDEDSKMVFMSFSFSNFSIKGMTLKNSPTLSNETILIFLLFFFANPNFSKNLLDPLFF